MTLRKLTLATVASVALASSAFAADTTNGQWGVGAGFVNSFGTTSPALTGTYLNSQFIVNAAMAYASYSPVGSNSYHAFQTGLAFGLRNMMNNQVSLDYGVNGGYGFVSKKSDSQKNPYSIGAFVGVDYMPVQNILFTASIDPYAYEHDINNAKSSRIFNTGAIGVSYMF